MISVVLPPPGDKLQEERAWTPVLKGCGPHCREGILLPQGPGTPWSSDGCTLYSRLGLHSPVVRSFWYCWDGWVWKELQNSPPYPLGSTRHSGSNCMSLGSSAGCTGSGLLRCCCGHTDSPRVGGKGRRCGASSGGSGDAPYCSGRLLWQGGGVSVLADSHRTWSAGSREQWVIGFFPEHTQDKGELKIHCQVAL